MNSTLALLALVSTGNYVAVMPRQIATQSIASQFISIIDVEEDGLDLEVGAILRTESALSPVVRNLITHLHRAANQVSHGSII